MAPVALDRPRRIPQQELDEELRFHLEQRTRDYIDRGMSPESARKAAAERFGDPARVRDVCAPMLAADRASEARRTLWRVSWLDVKLGLRMFVKYPGLSLVSVIGMAVAIAIGAGYFTVLGTWLDATLPLPEGDRIVSIRNLVNGSSLDDASGADFLRVARRAQVGARSRRVPGPARAISPPTETRTSIHVAAMTASGFSAARVAPIMGRALVDGDERPGAPPVVVIGYEEWQRRFGGRPADPRSHGPARRHRARDRRRDAGRIRLSRQPSLLGAAARLPRDRQRSSCASSARLADGLSMSEARAEAATIGAGWRSQFPQTHGRRRPTRPALHARLHRDPGARNGAVHARRPVRRRPAAPDRRGERRDPRVCAHRHAHGRDRRPHRARRQPRPRRLAVVRRSAGAVGRGGRHRPGDPARRVEDAPRRLENESDGAGLLPFLVDFRLTPTVILYVTLLAILAAVIAGVLPALKATGRRVQQGLQQFSARGAGVQLGPTWTALIVAAGRGGGGGAAGGPLSRRGILPPRGPASRRRRRTDWSAPRSALSREGRAQGLEKRLPEFTTALTQRLEADPGDRRRSRSRIGFPARRATPRSRSKAPANAATAADGAAGHAGYRASRTSWPSISSTCSRCRSSPAADSARPTRGLIRTRVIVDDTFVQQRRRQRRGAAGALRALGRRRHDHQSLVRDRRRRPGVRRQLHVRERAVKSRGRCRASSTRRQPDGSRDVDHGDSSHRQPFAATGAEAAADCGDRRSRACAWKAWRGWSKRGTTARS